MFSGMMSQQDGDSEGPRLGFGTSELTSAAAFELVHTSELSLRGFLREAETSVRLRARRGTEGAVFFPESTLKSAPTAFPKCLWFQQKTRM